MENRNALMLCESILKLVWHLLDGKLVPVILFEVVVHEVVEKFTCFVHSS